MKKHLILLLFSGLLNNACYSQYDCKELIRLLMISEISDTADLALLSKIDLDLEFAKKGKEAIPYLIQVIDRKKNGLVGCNDDKSSKLQTAYIGMYAAYQIEKILGDTSICSTIYRIDTLNSGKDQFCIGSLPYQDMKAIKKIYKLWWKQNCYKPLEELKTEWVKFGSPLRSSKYKWVAGLQGKVL